MPALHSNWRQPLWLATLVAASIAFSLGFACATPLAAFAAAAALTLRRRDAAFLTLAVWFANQAVGYGVLVYPWTATSIAWGIGLGMAALLACLAAEQGARAALFMPPAGAFATGFVAYELTLFGLAASVLGGVEGFALPIVVRILAINVVAFGGLMVLDALARRIGLIELSPRPRPAGTHARA